jgi:hypothetical protein
LHAAAFAGAATITKALLSNGANTGCLDTFRKTPIQIALEQAFVSVDFAKNKLGGIYAQLLSDSMKIQADGHLIKIDSRKVEYLLINLFMAVQPVILQKKLFYEEMGVKVDDLIGNMQHFPGSVVPPYRKKREYLLSLLAKHEIDSANPYNKKIFKRVSRGYYVLNPGLSVLLDDQWVSVVDIFKSRDFSEDEIRDHAWQKNLKEMEAFHKKIERDIKKREKWGGESW